VPYLAISPAEASRAVEVTCADSLTGLVQRLSSLTSLFTVAVGVFRRGGSQELAPAMERDRGGVPCHSSPEPEVDSERGFTLARLSHRMRSEDAVARIQLKNGSRSLRCRSFAIRS
jgi:hypothetical protein